MHLHKVIFKLIKAKWKAAQPKRVCECDFYSSYPGDPCSSRWVKMWPPLALFSEKRIPASRRCRHRPQLPPPLDPSLGSRHWWERTLTATAARTNIDTHTGKYREIWHRSKEWYTTLLTSSFFFFFFFVDRKFRQIFSWETEITGTWTENIISIYSN